MGGFLKVMYSPFGKEPIVQLSKLFKIDVGFTVGERCFEQRWIKL
jgi:hypothetical protein